MSPAPAPLSLPDTTPAPRRHPTRHLAGATALTASLTGLRRRITKRQLSVAAVVLAALVVVGAIALAMHTMVSGDAPSQSATTAVAVTPGGEFPAGPPLEWAKSATWSSPVLMPEAKKVAVVDGTKVGIVTADRQVALVDDQGSTVWSHHLPGGTVRSPLTLTMIDNSRALAIHVGDRLAWWMVDDGTEGGVALPSETAPITWRGDTPLIGTSTDTVALIQAGQLATVKVPQGATAVSAWTDGHVNAGAPTGWWQLKPGQEAGNAHPWETPASKPETLTVIDAMGPAIATVHPSSTGKGLEVVIHQDTGDGIHRLMAGQVPGAKPGDALNWFPSSSRTWAIVATRPTSADKKAAEGRALVDLQRGTVTDLGGPLSVASVIADRAFGTINGQRVVVSPDAPTGLMSPSESVVEEVLGRNALVRSSSNGQERIWLLPPNPAVPTVKK
ncbi:hypothetical protein [Mobilicoccus caccae]|uniref:hypothetical protein n=1 Tax=Mobilicoccus caccae TaxID=1859295 RepID=UPI0024E090AD|nr:hypothetical protein [Mobilicoccus caccae]